jgi:hypothetical protein
MALALLTTMSAFAQETSDPSPTPAPESPATSAESRPEPEREAPPARDDSPYDYQASEEISEDLSVSFPVDI